MLKIRPYKESDAETIVSWIKDEVSLRKWSADRYGSYPINAKDMNRYYADFPDTEYFHKLTAYDENGIIGHMIIRFVDIENRICRFGFVIVDDSKRGKGYGKRMLELAIDHAFEVMKAKKIDLVVFDNNESALNCYKAAGFKEVATDEEEYFHVLDEDWKRLKLEYIGN